MLWIAVIGKAVHELNTIFCDEEESRLPSELS